MNNEQTNISEFKSKVFTSIVFTSFIFGLIYIYFSGRHDEKIMKEHGVDTECVTVAYAKGKTGSRGPVEGFHNKCVYFINDSIHYCYIFTSQKPLPVGLKLKVRYLVHEDGRVTINFPDEYETEYAEYGFNDYGY